MADCTVIVEPLTCRLGGVADAAMGASPEHDTLYEGSENVKVPGPFVSVPRAVGVSVPS